MESIGQNPTTTFEREKNQETEDANPFSPSYVNSFMECKLFFSNLRMIFSFTFYPVPDQPPDEIIAHVSSSTSINVSWSSVPLGHTNGLVTGYRVFYIDATETQAKLNVTVESNIYSAELTGLLPHTNYCIQVLAFTNQDDGNISDCLIALTREDGKGVNHFMPLVRLKVRSHCKLKVANSCWHFQVCECEREFQPTIICVNCCVSNTTN